MCLIFVDSVHNFDRSDGDFYLVKKCLFPLDAYMVSCPTRSKNLGLTLLYTATDLDINEIWLITLART